MAATNFHPTHPAASHANHLVSRALQALVIMSCTAKLRALGSSTPSLNALHPIARPFHKIIISRTVSRCTQCTTHYSTLSLRSAVPTQRPLRSLQQSRPQDVRFISKVVDEKKRRAFVALGSNMGDRVAMIEQACKEMEASGKIKILRTTSLWETKAMYVVDQDKFVNGACEVGQLALATLPAP